MPPANLQGTARLFHALSDETRLQILDRLRLGECCVCELTDELDAAQSRLSFHLRTLKDAGLVSDRRCGRWVYYRIRPEALEQMDAVLEPLRQAATRGGGTAARDLIFFSRAHQHLLMEGEHPSNEL